VGFVDKRNWGGGGGEERSFSNRLLQREKGFVLMGGGP